MRVSTLAAVLWGVFAMAGAAASQAAPPAGAGTQIEALPPLARDVWNTEVAFARTMADRDHAAFGSFLSDEAVFMGAASTLRGKAQVADGWHRYFEAKEPPFSWRPDRVEVLDSGTLASSSGPVFDPQGKRIGTFNSVWRLEAGGRWRIIFDKGCPPCDCR